MWMVYNQCMSKLHKKLLMNLSQFISNASTLKELPIAFVQTGYFYFPLLLLP
jgi:hypothetical protein